MLRALALRIRAAFGIDLVTDILDDELTREQEGLDRAHASATRTEGLVERLQRHWREAMHDGQLTPAERRLLARDQRALAQSAHTTTEHLNLLRS